MGQSNALNVMMWRASTELKYTHDLINLDGYGVGNSPPPSHIYVLPRKKEKVEILVDQFDKILPAIYVKHALAHQNEFGIIPIMSW